jgi:hypothetical protein
VEKSYLPAPASPALLSFLYLGCAGLALFILWNFNPQALTVQLTGCGIIVLAIIPSYLWCANKVSGLPVFPPFALSHVATYGLPLITIPKSVARYEQIAAVHAGLTATAFLLLTTVVWYLIVRRPARMPRAILVLSPGTGSTVLLLYLSIACGFQVSAQAGWLELSPGLYSLVRSASLALGVLATAGLAHELGARKLTPFKFWAFALILTLYLLVQTVSLYLSAAFMTTLIGAVAFSASRRRLPLAWLTTVFAVTLFLQPGKAEMRTWIWSRERGASLTPLDYPAFFQRWAEASVSKLQVWADGTTPKKSRSEGIDRASIVHMLMLVQEKTPDPKPYLNGQTYEVIPELLVPRILNEQKARALAGQYILCIYYGLQTRAQTHRTGIAFGLPAEAYANFGYTGIVALALILGCMHGLVTRYCFALPVLSLRSLFALIFIGLSLRSEASGAVVVTTLVQATAVLFAGTWFIMTPLRLAPPEQRIASRFVPPRPATLVPSAGVQS